MLLLPPVFSFLFVYKFISVLFLFVFISLFVYVFSYFVALHDHLFIYLLFTIIIIITTPQITVIGIQYTDTSHKMAYHCIKYLVVVLACTLVRVSVLTKQFQIRFCFCRVMILVVCSCVCGKIRIFQHSNFIFESVTLNTNPLKSEEIHMTYQTYARHT